MPRLPAAFRRGIVLLAFIALLPACQPREGVGGQAIGVAKAVRIEAATRPVDAANLLRDRLLAHDGAGFARLAVPAALHARLVAGWKDGRSRWPLDELPLDGRLPKMLATLQAPGADKALIKTFRQQFAGADRDIDQAIRTLVLFGGEYVQNDGEYTPEERDHIAQAIVALGAWGLQAPFAEKPRAQRFFTALTAAARRSGIPGKSGQAAFARLGMDASLTRLSPFLATLLAQLRQQYGLDIDASLRALRVTLLQQTGDTARLRLQYPLAGREIDAVVPAVRIDGHWYLADFVQRAESSLAATPASARGKKPAPP
ncbi:MAG TPA: hypothetical protein VLC71_01255 [Thermomonas sp.]|nr:hypothetical protein [Thermomonas sp.]